MPNPDKTWERFRIIRQLGVGAFGRTLLVTDAQKQGRQVVIKVPLDKEKEKALVKELIVNGALAARLAGMEHPNIVKFLGFDKFEDFFVMILEYVPCRDLRRIIGPISVVRRPMGMERAFQVFENVCSGLAAAHETNVVHRDIKPENILVRDEDGVAKLTDFGISTIMESSGGSGTVAGTFPYMAPEALAGAASFSSDLWSLSVTMYEMVTGHLPFLDDNLFTLKKKIDSETPIAPRELNPDIDEKLNAMILKGLEKSASNRFRSAQEMLDSLGPGLDEEIGTVDRLAQAGQEDEAERLVRGLLEHHPDEPRLHLFLGRFFGQRLQFHQAEVSFRRGLVASPRDAELHYRLAVAMASQGPGNLARAAVEMRNALDLGLSTELDRQGRNLLRGWEREKERS